MTKHRNNKRPHWIFALGFVALLFVGGCLEEEWEPVDVVEVDDECDPTSESLDCDGDVVMRCTVKGGEAYWRDWIDCGNSMEICVEGACICDEGTSKCSASTGPVVTCTDGAWVSSEECPASETASWVCAAAECVFNCCIDPNPEAGGACYAEEEGKTEDDCPLTDAGV
ncbi:MAG: hypothetical protein GY847_20420 [Proteobacteria bacterium]|nr:hypothetical protein [Pseudomonadota bacterium]